MAASRAGPEANCVALTAVIAIATTTLRGIRTQLRGREQHVRNFFSFILCRAVALVLFAFSVTYFLNGRGRVQYGTIALLFTVFSYITMLDLGMSYAVNLRFTRALTRSRDDAHRIVAAAVPVYFTAGVLAGVILMLAAPMLSHALFASGEQTAAIRVLGATSVFVLMSAVLTGTIQAYNRVDLVNLSRAILDVAKAAALIVAAQSENPVLVAMWAVLLGVVLKTVADALIVRKLVGGLGRLAPIVRLAEVRLNLRFGLPMAATSVVSIIFMTADRVYVSRVLGPAALTSYSIGADICSKAFFLVSAVTGSVYTLLVRRNATGLGSAGLQRVSLAAVAAVALLFYVPLLVFTPQLLTAWLGAATVSDVILVTRIWCLAAIAYLTLTVYYNYLQAAGKPGALFVANVAASTAMIFGLVLMPRSFDIAGVACIVCATFTGEAVALWAVSRFVAARVRAR